MRETPVANLEKNFLLEAIKDGKRVDGRNLDERRGLTIQFGSELGTCLATLGQTKVFASVTATVAEPSPSRPCEGVLQIYIDFLPMCAPRFVDAKYSSLTDEVTETARVIERCLKESRCLDMESLCIVAEEKVWQIRLDLKVLNHEGCVADCSSVAGLAALAHFKRPDVSLLGDIIQIHPVNERDPLPLAIHHYPICSTFAFFTIPGNPSDDSSKAVVADPSHFEEAVMNGKLILGVNPYREICTLHMAGQMVLEKGVIVRLAHKCAEHAKTVVGMIKSEIEKDTAVRLNGGSVCLGIRETINTILNHGLEKPTFVLEKALLLNVEEVSVAEPEPDLEIVKIDEGLIEMTDKMDVKQTRPKPSSPQTAINEDDSDSEEEEVRIL